MPVIEFSLRICSSADSSIIITYTIYYNQISVHQNQLGKMDALQQQDLLLRNDGIVDSLGNEASFLTSSELIMTSLFSYISIKNLNLRFRYQFKSGELLLQRWRLCF